MLQCLVRVPATAPTDESGSVSTISYNVELTHCYIPTSTVKRKMQVESPDARDCAHSCDNFTSNDCVSDASTLEVWGGT